MDAGTGMRPCARGLVAALVAVFLAAAAGCRDAPGDPKAPAPAAKPAPVQRPGLARRITGRDGAPMVLIPAGEFTMGSNGDDDAMPPHRVAVSSFYMDKHEVTFDLFDRFCEATGRTKPSDSGWGRGSQPVIHVTWDDAVAYAAHHGKRLPTEAEWEYACRAGGAGNWCFGDDVGRLGEYAWFDWNSGGRTHPVGRKSANAWGLHDMHGNVWEWCADWYDAGYYAGSPARDPAGPSSGQSRVQRGGCCFNIYVGTWSAIRGRNDPNSRNSVCGFRCVSSAVVR